MRLVQTLERHERWIYRHESPLNERPGLSRTNVRLGQALRHLLLGLCASSSHHAIITTVTTPSTGPPILNVRAMTLSRSSCSVQTAQCCRPRVSILANRSKLFGLQLFPECFCPQSDPPTNIRNERNSTKLPTYLLPPAKHKISFPGWMQRTRT